jgi:hypothetical protein
MPDIWDQAAKELTKEDPWAAAEHQLGKTQARFKTRAQIDKEVTSNPTLLESGALGLERLTGFKPVGDLARWAQASEVEARTAPPQESPGFVRSVVDSFVHPIDAVGKGATQVSAALRADQNLQEGESLTFDEQLGRVAQGTGGAFSMLAPIGSLAGVGALGKAGATLVTQGGKAAATQLARSAAAPVAGLAGGAVGGTLSGEATKLMGGGPGAQALAQLSGGITGGSLGARAGYQRAYPAPLPQATAPVVDVPRPIRGLLAEPTVDQPVGTVVPRPGMTPGRFEQTTSSYAELPSGPSRRIPRATGGDDVEARARVQSELGPSAYVLPERLLAQGAEQLEFAADAAQRGYGTASTNAGRALYKTGLEDGPRSITVPETEAVFPPPPQQSMGTRQVPVSQALKELPALEARYGKRVDLLESMRQRLNDQTLPPARRQQLEANVQQLEPIAKYIQSLREWQGRFAQAKTAPASSATSAAGGRTATQLEADAQRATGVVGVVPRTMREKVGVWAEDQYRQHLNPEHPMNVRERASGAAGERPVDATTGEPLAAYSPARYTAWMRRGSPGVDQEIMDHPMHAELNKLGTLATMKELGLNTAKGVVQTITQGLSPVQQKFEHYLKVRTDLEDLQQGRSMTHGIYKDAAGVEYTPTLAELQNVVATRAPVFGKAAAALYDFRDQFIRKPLLEAGLLKPQMYADFVANYKEHTPQQRALGPTGLFDLELRQTAPHQAPAGQGALGVKVPVMAKKGSGLQAVDVLANVLDEAHQAHRLARANAAGKLVVKPAAVADAQGNIVTPAKVGGEDMVRYPPGVEVNPKQIGLGMDVVRTYENGEFVDTVMPQALAESLRVGIRQGAPTAANKAWDAINGLAKAGFTSLRAGFALVSNVPLTGQEVAAKSRGGLGSAANLVRYAPEWALSRALPHGVKLEGKMGQALGHARANPGPFMRRLIQETEPVPGRILKDAAGNVTGINLTAAFENARRSGAGGALGVMHEGNPRTMAESILYPPNTLGYWARSFRHPLQRLGHLAQRTAHVMSVDELGRIAADRATLTRARGGMVRDKGVLRRYTEEEAQAEGARDAIESLSDFTLLTPTIKGLQLLAPFVNPALQSTRVHAKGMAGHRGVDGQRQEAVAVSAAALGGYLSTLYNLSDPSRAKHFLSMSTDDRSRGWTWVSPDQQDEGPKRFTGHIVALDGPMRVAADAARGVAERQFGAPDKYDTNGARQTLTRALENLSGLSSDESWFLNLGMQLGYGLRPDGSKLDGVRGNAEASDLAKGMARVTGKGPGHMQAVINVVPGSQYVFPRARPRDPYYTTNPAMAPMLEIEKRLRTVPANRVFEERALQRLEAARKRGWK